MWYRESFDAPSSEAYETLLLDVMNSDPMLFMRADQEEAAWQWLMPVIDVWAKVPPSDFPNYVSERVLKIARQGDCERGGADGGARRGRI